MDIFGFILTTGDVWFLGIAGALALVWIGFHLTNATNRKTRFNQASATFRTKILTELEGLYPIPTKWPSEKMVIDRILKEKFANLQIAITEFKEFLPLSQRADFDKAWFIYRLGEDGREIDQQDYWQYIPHSGKSVANGKEETHDNTETYQGNFKRNVDNILKFAKHT
jgi:hypothetical protein